MTLEQYAYLSEIIAAAAVVASLIYLSIQVRQSNLLSRAQTRHAMTELTTDNLYKVIEHPGINAAITKEAISFDEKTQLQAWLLANLLHRQYEWFAGTEGIADPAMSEAYSRAIRIVLGAERTRRWWDSLKYEHAFDPRFVSFVDGLLENSSATYFDTFDRWE